MTISKFFKFFSKNPHLHEELSFQERAINRSWTLTGEDFFKENNVSAKLVDNVLFIQSRTHSGFVYQCADPETPESLVGVLAPNEYYDELLEEAIQRVASIKVKRKPSSALADAMYFMASDSFKQVYSCYDVVCMDLWYNFKRLTLEK